MARAGVVRRHILSAVSTIAVISGIASAEGIETGDAQDLDIITVYGTTNPVPAFEYPGQVSVMSKDEIEMINPSSLSDILRDVPGIEFSGGPRRTGEVPSIRGLSGENVLILLDGARQSFVSAHDGRFFIDPHLIGTAEVVRGPASALYGSGAVGGVLALETVDAADLLGEDEHLGIRFHTGYQSVNEETVGSVTAYSRQNGFDALGSFGVRQSSDIELGSGADLSSDDEIQTALLKLGYQFTDAFRIEGSWQHFENTAIEPNNGQGTAGTGDSVLDRDVEKDIDSDTYRLGIAYNPESDWVDANLTYYLANNAVREFDATLPRTTLREIETTGLSARNASRFTFGSHEVTLTIGGDWYKDEQVGTDSETTNGTRGGVPNGETEFTGVFAQIEASFDRPLGLPGELLVIPGIRYDEFESSSEIDASSSEDSATSPRFAASYAPIKWFRVFGSYAEGFRAPSINELYLDGVHFSVPHPTLFNPTMGSFVFVNNNFIPNATLVPEKTDTTEIGLGIDFNGIFSEADRLQGKVSYFQSDVEDLINLSVDFAYDQTCFTGPSFFPCSAGTSASSNIDNAELDGVEAEFQYDSRHLYGKLSYSSVDGEDKSDGSDIGTLTPDRIALNLAWKAFENRWRIGTRVQWADDFERHEANTSGGLEVVEQRDSYTVVDLYASWNPTFTENLRVDFGIDNIFEEDYERVFQGVSEPARNFKVSASYAFAR